jgi:hypothetical protein
LGERAFSAAISGAVINTSNPANAISRGMEDLNLRNNRPIQLNRGYTTKFFYWLLTTGY